MLHNHSNIVVPPECGFAVWWHEKYQNWDSSAYSAPNTLGQFLQDLNTSKKIETWDLDYDALEK